MTFVTFSRRDWLGRKRFYFRLVAMNNETVAQSEGYSNRVDRDETINLIRARAGGARLGELDE